jgi:hypothetical protein
MDNKHSLLSQTQMQFIKSLSGRNLSIHTATAYQTDIMLAHGKRYDN